MNKIERDFKDWGNATKPKSVSDYARKLPMFDTEYGRMIALSAALRRVCRTLSALYDHDIKKTASGNLNPWFKESLQDALNELVAHLEINGALKESVDFSCLNHHKKQEKLIAFIREIAKDKGIVWTKDQKATLKAWKVI